MDISSCDAVKLKMPNTSQENTHTASSHLTKEKKFLEGFSVKTLIARGKMMSVGRNWMILYTAN